MTCNDLQLRLAWHMVDAVASGNALAKVMKLTKDKNHCTILLLRVSGIIYGVSNAVVSKPTLTHRLFLLLSLLVNKKCLRVCRAICIMNTENNR